MAALDPTEEAGVDDSKNAPSIPRSTLRLVKRSFSSYNEDEEDDDELSDQYMSALLGGSDDEDDESNGGPSDLSKAKKQKQAAAIKKLLEAANGVGSDDEEMEDAEAKPKKGKKAASAKGKGKAVVEEQEEVVEEEEEEDEDEEDDEDDESETGDLENFVVCTLDTERVSLSDYESPMKSFFLRRCSSNYNSYGILTPITELPATSRYYRQPGREGFLRRFRYTHCLPDWKLHYGRYRGG